MTKTLASYWRFLMAGVIHHNQTGALFPSQRFLIDRMISPVPLDYDGQILELGPGTGVLTLRLAKCRPKARVLACEINPMLAEDLQYRVTRLGLQNRVQVVSGSAEHLLSTAGTRGFKAPDFIISGIPLGNLNRQQVLTLIDGISRGLQHGGLYIQFQYSLIDRKKIRDRFRRLRTVPVLLNVPPAFVYFAQK